MLSQGDVRRVWIIESGPEIGERLGQGLRAQACAVSRFGDASDRPGLRSLDFSNRAAIAAGFATAASDGGLPHIAVLAIAPDILLSPTPFVTMDFSEWESACHGALKRCLRVMQVLHALMQGHALGIVGLGPTPALLGSEGLVAMTTAMEAQRGLFKSAARQWGRGGIRLNWIALAAEVYAPQLAGAALPASPELGPPPLPLEHRPDVEHDLASLIAFLATAGSAALTGATLNLDGGEWMLP